MYLAGGEKREQEQWKGGEQGDKSKRGVREKGIISVGYQLRCGLTIVCVCVCVCSRRNREVR